MMYEVRRSYSLPDIIHGDNIIQKVSEEFLNITGYRPDEIAGKSIGHVFGILLRAGVAMEKVLNSQDSFYIFTRNLEPREVKAEFYYSKEGELCVTVLEKANSRIEDKLPYVEQLYRIEKSGIAVFSAVDKILLKANNTFIDFLSWSNNKKDCIGKDAREVSTNFKDFHLGEIWSKFLKNNQCYYGTEIMNNNCSRGITYWDISIVPILDNGISKYFVVNTIDVSERVRGRVRIKTLENTMKMKEEFLATITHEFKTPLAVINAVLQTIDSIYANQVTDHVKKHLQRIRINTFRQLRLVNHLLDITRYNSGRFKMNRKNIDIVFVSEAIVNSVDLYSAQKGVNLFFSSDIKCLVMAMDEEKYERILLNLLSNSIKFTPKGKAIYVHISYKNRKAFISVRDEGIGIPKSKQKLIFERFGQVDSTLSRQAEGTGIGLSLVKTLVEGMNGTISIDSEIEEGSTFTVALPVTRLKRKEQEDNIISSPDNRIMQAVAIEFSDIYLS